jgi:hypothetical protein
MLKCRHPLAASAAPFRRAIRRSAVTNVATRCSQMLNGGGGSSGGRPDSTASAPPARAAIAAALGGEHATGQAVARTA